MLTPWQFLKKSVELGRIPQALLFCGPDSKEKLTLAFEWVKLLNGPQALERVRPDLLLVGPIDDNKEIEIAQVRELQLKLSLKSYSAPFKIAIINQAHFLNQEAQSAFLKLLEEPKGKTVFILITQYPGMLLPTILSRVERLRFYSASAQFEPDENQKKFISDLLSAKRQNLASRFQCAKKLSETPENLRDILETWLKYLRNLFLQRVKSQSVDSDSVLKLKNILQSLQTTSFLISTTNVNPRLALEIFFLNL